MNRQNWSILAIGIMCLFALLGCANMNEAQCKNADWQAIGYEDGVSGQAESDISRHRIECSEYGVAPDLDAYLEGHFRGAAKYCTNTNGFFEGARGKQYNLNCPAEFAGRFLQGLKDGKALYAAEVDMNRAKFLWSSALKEIETFETRSAAKRDQLVADGLDKAERLALLQEIDEIAQDIKVLNTNAFEYEQEYIVFTRAYKQVKHRFSSYFE
jgi:hypothetical protein